MADPGRCCCCCGANLTFRASFGWIRCCDCLRRWAETPATVAGTSSCRTTCKHISLGTLRKVSHLSIRLVLVIMCVLLTICDVMGVSKL